MAANADALTTRFYEHLFEIDESAATLFAGVDMTAQRTKLGQTLAVMIDALDDIDRLLPALAALGKRHTRYGIEPRHFDSVGDALLWALRDTLGSAFTPELHDAWSQVYKVVASVMLRALERQSIAETS